MKVIEYREEFGEVEFPEGFEEELRGKSLGEQMERFRITSAVSLTKTYYGDAGDLRILEGSHALDDDGGFVGLILKGGVIVGVLIKSWRGGEEPCLPNRCVCTYWASDKRGLRHQRPRGLRLPDLRVAFVFQLAPALCMSFH